TPTQYHWGSKLLAGVHLTNQGSTTNPKKSKSGFPPPPCQVSETPELTRVVRQFIEANRAPRDVETDF
ncbi:MAG: transposase, partial [Dolichospermum sp.]